MQINFILGEKAGSWWTKMDEKDAEGWKLEAGMGSWMNLYAVNQIRLLVFSVLCQFYIPRAFFKSLDRCFFLGVRVFKSVIKESESQNYNTTLWNQIFSQKRSWTASQKTHKEEKSFSNLNCFSCFSDVSEKVTASDEMYCKYGSNQAQDPRFHGVRGWFVALRALKSLIVTFLTYWQVVV